ncbi:LOW QUALITY PROTEIN: hypothetical protein TorRG33x02_239500 [Trema orientale]|uniref:Uncharacterized protein n=1 Tax=Trema orientale TaxID=63057 RepID=A0A2P5DX13_TREOI|nr:LOW QUALITY PROTEIN: hypothetical protein TorRG33x02_239500 [Trema orientale]
MCSQASRHILRVRLIPGSMNFPSGLGHNLSSQDISLGPVTWSRVARHSSKSRRAASGFGVSLGSCT